MSGKKDVWNAVISTVLGTIGSSLAPQQKKLAELGEQSKEWTDKAKNLGKNLYDDVKHWNEPKPDIAKRNFLAGTLMGLLLGAGSAAFLNTKSGKKIKKGVSGTY
jgi:gas vesicle protein